MQFISEVRKKLNKSNFRKKLHLKDIYAKSKKPAIIVLHNFVSQVNSDFFYGFVGVFTGKHAA